MIKNSVPAHSLHGVPVYGNRPAGAVTGSRLASASGPYIGRGDKCTGNDDTCGANRVRGQELCVGHSRKTAKYVVPIIKEL
jgi:hypothetical protein